MSALLIVFIIVVIIYLLFLLYLKLTTGRCKSKKRLDNKTVIITGADKGIGYETALDLARRNARLIMACRDVANAEKMAEKIRSETGNQAIFVRKINLSSLASVREFVENFLGEERGLHILINNAGMPSDTYRVHRTSEGFEIVFVTNYLGHFLLTTLLLDRLRRCSPGRIINVSALAHKMITSLDLSDLNCEKTSCTMSLYGKSKALQILFTRELARQLEGTGITVNCLHPGVIRTNFANKFPQPIKMIATLLSLFLPSAKDGAQTSIYLAVDESLENVSGKYFSNCHIAKTSKLMQDDELAEKVFDISENYVQE